MARELNGLPIAITGASSGIGAATALECARAGMPVAVAARRADRLEALVQQIVREGGRAIAVPMDVDRAEDNERLVARTAETFGSVYAVFANAGYGFEGTMLDTPEQDLRAIFETNYFASITLARAALPHMRRAGRGHILMCSSCLALLPMPWYGHYSATKSAQHHAARAMDVELRDVGIRVSSVHPVGTRTEFFDTAAARTPGGKTSLLDRSTSGMFMQPPERVARAVVRCLRRPRPEVWTSLPARLGFLLAGMMPGATNRILGAMATRKRGRTARGKP